MQQEQFENVKGLFEGRGTFGVEEIGLNPEYKKLVDGMVFVLKAKPMAEEIQKKNENGEYVGSGEYRYKLLCAYENPQGQVWVGTLTVETLVTLVSRDGKNQYQFVDAADLVEGTQFRLSGVHLRTSARISNKTGRAYASNTLGHIDYGVIVQPEK